MNFTFALSKNKTPLKQNLPLLTMAGLFMVGWAFTLFTTTDINNWLLENTLVFVFLGVLGFTYKKYAFSDFSYLLIFVYLCLHIHGATQTYAEAPAGYWLQDVFGGDRNNYDRIVHFSFGFLLAYPMRELFVSAMEFKPWVGWILPAEITLSFSGLYELIEWAVADLFFPEQGVAYLGSQGDPWDAQKDMALAFVGSILILLLISGIKRTFKRQEL